jgi:Zn-dependent protease with chaperone function
MSGPTKPLVLPLRHPRELGLFSFMVVLNLLVLSFLLDVLIKAGFVPQILRGTGWETVTRTAAAVIILTAPVLLIVRQIQRASIQGTAVQLSPSQFPDLVGTLAEFAGRLGMKRTPSLYLLNGNGTLNAFAAQSGWTRNYVAVSNELFANLRNHNREGLRFILGHEVAHIRLSHVSLWYQLAICYTGWIPILGPTLSRLREYSCDRNGAALEPQGARGLVLLAAGRYAADEVDIRELVEQGRGLRGFWVELAQLQRSHPWTVRRLWRLHQLGLFVTQGVVPRPMRANRAQVPSTGPGGR